MPEPAQSRRARKQAAPSEGVQPLPAAAVASTPAASTTALPGLALDSQSPAGGSAADAGPQPEDSLDNYKDAKGEWGAKPIAGKLKTGSTESKRDDVKQIKEQETAGHEKAVADWKTGVVESLATGKAPPKKPIKKTIAHQPVADLGEIYAHTGMLKAEFEHQVNEIAKATKGKTQFRSGEGMKSIGRALEKIVADYKGDESRLVDVTGGSVYYQTPDDLIAGFQAIETNKLLKLARVKNTLKNADGYGDINLSIEVGGGDYDMEKPDGTVKHERWDGFIVELQLHLQPIIDIKEKAHKLYEEQREIAARNSDKAEKDWSWLDRRKHRSLGEQMKKMFNGDGWKKCIPEDDLMNTALVDKLAPLRQKLADAIPEK